MPDDSNSIIKRIEATIDKLAEDIRRDDNFGKGEIVNIHGLVCLMRYAIWNDELSFKKWILDNEFNKNEGVLERIYLYKDIAEDGDGVEIRIHIFKDGNETFRHNHGQDFVTMCIHGEYEYSYYTAIKKEGYSYDRFQRLSGSGKLVNQESIPGKIVKAKLVEGQLVPSPGAEDLKFSEGSLPIFVPCKFYHTVTHKDKHVPVVTFVARRGKIGNHQTTVIQDLSQNHRDARDDQNPVKMNPSSEEKELIYQLLKKALLRRGYSDINYEITDQNKPRRDLRHYLTGLDQLVRFQEDDVNEEWQKYLIYRFLKSNNFTSAPIISANKCVSILRRPASSDSTVGKLVEKSPQSIKHDEGILGAVLWNVASRDLVSPVVDDDDDLIGLFSISDLVESDEEFDRALIYSIAKHKRTDDGERISRKFLERLKDLNEAAFNEDNLHTSKELDELTNLLMLSLGPLIVISPDLDHGRFKNIAVDIDNVTPWIHESAFWPMYKLDVESFDEDSINESKKLLKMLSRGSEISQILLSNKDKVKLLHVSKGILDLEITESNASISEVIAKLSGSEIPVIVMNDSGEYGVLTKDDFCNEVAIKELCEFITGNNIDSNLRDAITNHVLRIGAGIKSTLQI